MTCHICRTCGGKGVLSDGRTPCDDCQGEGGETDNED